MNSPLAQLCQAAVLAVLVVFPAVAISDNSNPGPDQRIVLITGSTGGLGRETALALAKAGDHVIIHGRNTERAEKLIAEIEAGGKGSARFYKADLASMEETRGLADSILADYKRLDVLVNNAGVFMPNQKERRLTRDGYELHFQVNYLAGYILIDKLTPLLESSGSGRIVNVASGQEPLDFDDVMSENDYTGFDAYLRSKNAQIMMTFAMADDLKSRGITTDALFPSGFMDTDMVIEAGFKPESSVETGRDALVKLINDRTGTGRFFDVFEEGRAIDQAYDTSAQAELMRISTELTADDSRARDLGIPFEGQPGPLNAITDVDGVEVGHITLFEGNGELSVGKGPVRTGVTVIHPRGKDSIEGVFGGWFTLNASGEMTGTTWLQERGLLEGPIGITNTHSVGVVRDAAVSWMVTKGWEADWHAPVVAETYDGALNDINGFHVTRDDALNAMASATTGPVEEGAVGGGTGMVCNGFKGGIGTASRQFEVGDKTYVVGVLVQCNYNWDGEDFRLGGKPVSHLLPVGEHCFSDPSIERHVDWYPYCDESRASTTSQRTRDGSIIVVVATDAPLLPHQLGRVAKRPSLALGRLGAVSSGGSGDIFVAFSTANAGRIDESDFSEVTIYPNYGLTTVFTATVQATEEAIINAMVQARTVVGASGFRVNELPEDQVRALFDAGSDEVD